MKPYNMIAACVLAACVVAGFSDAAFCEPKLLAEFSVATGDEPILLPVTMNGKTYKFLLDTGANRTTFDKKLEPLLGDPKHIMEAELENGEKHQMKVFYAPDASVGPLSLQDAGPVFCEDLVSLREATGVEIDGALGNTILGRVAVQIDFDNGKVRFYENPSFKPEPTWGQPNVMEILPSGVPVIVVNLAGDIQNVMLVDSGYGDIGMLPAGLFDLIRKGKNMPTATSKHLRRNSEIVESVVGRIDDISVGENRYSGMTFDRSEANISLLGLGFLARHMVTFDFINDKLYLKKGKKFDQPDEIDMSGLHLLKKTNGIVVHSVDENSPAAKAGIQSDDILRRINNVDVNTLSLSNLRRQLSSGDGKEFEIIFQRGDKGFKTKLTLKKQL